MSDQIKSAIGSTGENGPKEVGDWNGTKKVHTNPIMQFFDPDRYKVGDCQTRALVGHFRYLAETLDKELPNSAEKSAGLRKLLEAQDCMIRAVVIPVAEFDEGKEMFSNPEFKKRADEVLLPRSNNSSFTPPKNLSDAEVLEWIRKCSNGEIEPEK